MWGNLPTADPLQKAFIGQLMAAAETPEAISDAYDGWLDGLRDSAGSATYEFQNEIELMRDHEIEVRRRAPGAPLADMPDLEEAQREIRAALDVDLPPKTAPLTWALTVVVVVIAIAIAAVKLG